MGVSFTRFMTGTLLIALGPRVSKYDEETEGIVFPIIQDDHAVSHPGCF